MYFRDNKRVVIECSVKGCCKEIWLEGERKYCKQHQLQIEKGVVFNTEYGNAGKNNGSWKGGIFIYKNHGKMKKVRECKIKEVNGLCEICGKKGKQIHHKDGSKTNHSLENLIFVCYKCHGQLHRGRKNKKKKNKERSVVYGEKGKG